MEEKRISTLHSRKIDRESMSHRILCVTPWFPNSPGDREGNYIFDSVMALKEHGLKVNVMLTRPLKPWLRNKPDFSAFPDDLDLRLIRYPSIPRDYLRSVSNRLLSSCVSQALVDYAKKHEVHLIHAHTEALASVAGDVARKLGIPSVVTIHGINTSNRYLGTDAQRLYFRSALNRVDRVILVGEPLRDFFAKITGRDDHFRVVHNGFNLPVDTQMRALFADDIVQMVSVSNLHEGKGIDITIMALAELKNRGISAWKYQIVGDGYMRPMLEKLVYSLQLEDQITFVGAVPHAAVASYLMKADVFVLPSYREAFGVAYLEAMACGLLTIGVREQGPSAFIRHMDTGLLALPQNINDVANLLALSIQEPIVMKGIAERGKKEALGRFSLRNHAQQLGIVYDELLAERMG